ncbi:MAG: cardiolipin synthase [Spirochaetaceae bacterium]|jgi:cardiolipin synthase|nr:cardiolipin synthase [Spirochaetaceae bacterium]
MKKRALVFFSKQKVFAMFLLLVQLAVIITLIITSSAFSGYIHSAFNLLSVLVSIHILNKNGKSAFKITWLFLILVFPIFGGLFYIVFYLQSDPKKYRQAIRLAVQESRSFFLLPDTALADLENDKYFIQARYLQEHSGFPVYKKTETLYFPSGEEFYKRLLTELEKAQAYIFLEFFIFTDGIMLNGIMNILKRKAQNGVDIRIIYDDLGCLKTLPENFNAMLKEAGITFQVFNPFRPVLSSLQNYRDHRKIVSIDGRTAFTGGINIGDEYINAYEKYGHWKDSAIMLKGHAAWSMSIMFLRMWNSSFAGNERKKSQSYMQFYPWKDTPCTIRGEGYVQPYSSNPISKEYVCEQVYLRIINSAENYVYINTPYLIPDEEVFVSLVSQARSGTDIRIITPHKPDKPLVHRVTRASYRRLIAAGVRIYEYSKGFNHSKTFVSDDICAAVGSANLDFRSLCLHFECGVWIYKTNTVLDIKNDFLNTLKECRTVTIKDCSRTIFQRIIDSILYILSPVL